MEDQTLKTNTTPAQLEVPTSLSSVPDINKIAKDLKALQDEFYRNNFSARQDFPKYSNFATRLKVPHFSALPSTCEAGEIGEFGGKLYICSAANTWTIAGTQS